VSLAGLYSLDQRNQWGIVEMPSSAGSIVARVWDYSRVMFVALCRIIVLVYAISEKCFGAQSATTMAAEHRLSISDVFSLRRIHKSRLVLDLSRLWL